MANWFVKWIRKDGRKYFTSRDNKYDVLNINLAFTDEDEDMLFHHAIKMSRIKKRIRAMIDMIKEANELFQRLSDYQYEPEKFSSEQVNALKDQIKSVSFRFEMHADSIHDAIERLEQICNKIVKKMKICSEEDYPIKKESLRQFKDRLILRLEDFVVDRDLEGIKAKFTIEEQAFLALSRK